jgi:hypothetical protein
MTVFVVMAMVMMMLLVIMQGGGACFDNASTNAVPSCPTDVYPGNRYPSIDIGPFGEGGRRRGGGREEMGGGGREGGRWPT